MANTVVALTNLALSASTANPAGTAIVAANTHSIAPTKASAKLLIRLTNTTASTKVFTVTAGDNPPADAQGQGDLTVSLTDGSTTPQSAFVTIESARFLQNDGTVVITVAASTTGSITAFQMP